MHKLRLKATSLRSQRNQQKLLLNFYSRTMLFLSFIVSVMSNCLNLLNAKVEYDITEDSSKEPLEPVLFHAPNSKCK